MVTAADVKDVLEKASIAFFGAFFVWLSKEKEAKDKREQESEEKQKKEDKKEEAAPVSAHDEAVKIMTGESEWDADKMFALLGEMNRQQQEFIRRQAVDSEYLKLGHRDRARLTSRMNCLFTASPDAIIFSDDNGVIIDWNEAATLLLGYPVREALGKPILMIVPPRYHADHLRGLQHWKQTGEGNVIGHGQADLFALHKSGEEIPIWLTLFADTPLGDDERPFVCGWLQKRAETPPPKKKESKDKADDIDRQQEP